MSKRRLRWWEADEEVTELELRRAAKQAELDDFARARLGLDSKLSKAVDEVYMPNVTTWGAGLGSGVIAPLARLTGQDNLADTLNMFGNAYRKAAAERDKKNTVLPPIVSRGLRGAGESIPTMVVAGHVGGPYAALAVAGGQEADKSITKGRLKGLKGGKLAGYAATQGAIEFAVGAAFQKAAKILGRPELGGAESMAAARRLVAPTMKEVAKRAGVSTLAELPEEILTEIGHNAADAISKVEPDALDWEKSLKQTIMDTSVQTLITMGVMTSPQIAETGVHQYQRGQERAERLGGIRRDRAEQQESLEGLLTYEGTRKWVDENPEDAAQVAAKESLTRSQWAGLGLPDRSSAESRAKFSKAVRGIMDARANAAEEAEAIEELENETAEQIVESPSGNIEFEVQQEQGPEQQPEQVEPEAVEESEEEIEEEGDDWGDDDEVVDAPAISDPSISPQRNIARDVSHRITFEGQPIDADTLFGFADRHYGGTRAEAKYGPSEAYDALEAGINMSIHNPEARHGLDRKSVEDTIAHLEELQRNTVSQTNRSGTKDTLQQFSTPPAYAYAAANLAKIQGSDVVLEPSAGTGSFVVHALNRGAEVHANEIDPKRAGLLQELGVENITTYDAEQIHNIMAGQVKPSVVLMNPPFSRAGTRMGTKMVPGTDRKHIDAALELLEDNGRLVAIIGAGLRGPSKGFTNWLEATSKKHNVRANVEVNRDVYKGYGTTFPTRVLVIDKSGPTPKGGTVTESADSLTDLVQLLEDVTNDRARTQPKPAGKTSGKPSGKSKGGKRPKSDGDSSADAGSTKAGKPKAPSTDDSKSGDGGKDGEVASGSQPEPKGTEAEGTAAGGKRSGTKRSGSGGGRKKKATSSDEAGGRTAKEPVRESGGKPSDRDDGGKSLDEMMEEAMDDEFGSPEQTSKPVPSALAQYPKKIDNGEGKMVDRPPIFLSGISNETVMEAAKGVPNFGVMIAPRTAQYRNHLDSYEFFGIDNGGFTGTFNEKRFYKLLDDIREAGHAHKALFAAAPDVYYREEDRGDWAKTVAQAPEHLKRIREAGFPAAIVIQDGATVETVPWDLVDALFIGGSTNFKTATTEEGGVAHDGLMPIVREAKKRNIPTHFGRVNSPKRLDITHFGLLGDSVDGTYIKWSNHADMTKKVLDWLKPWGQFPSKQTEIKDAGIPPKTKSKGKKRKTKSKSKGKKKTEARKKETKSELDQAWQEFKDTFTEFDAGISPKKIQAAVKLTRAAVNHGIATFQDFIQYVADNIGVANAIKIDNYLESAWRTVRKRPEYSQLDEEGSVKEVLAPQDRPSIDRKESIDENVVFEPYVPSAAPFSNAQPHPASAVESASMAAVNAPADFAIPNVDPELIRSGALSEVQLEFLAYAVHANEQVDSAGVRQGFLIGDGTGMGKGREIASVFHHNFREGRKKGLWVSKSQKLHEDAVRDWVALGGKAEDVVNLSKTNANDQIDLDEGILFTTYDTLGSAAKVGAKTRRVDQVSAWLGDGFDGVIAYDEAHMMGSGTSGRAGAGRFIQDRFTDARVVYASATAATEVEQMRFGSRLGLWGAGTPFQSESNFSERIGGAGVAAMESVALSLKAMGRYASRSISFNDGTEEGTVDYDRVEHKLEDHQVAMYDRIAEAWQGVIASIEDSLDQTGADSNSRGRARGMFWSSHQRFFNTLVTSMQMPAILGRIEQDIADGNSVVLQLTNTGEADQERAFAGRRDDQSLEDFSINPFETLTHLVRTQYPTQAFEEYVDAAGNVRKRPAYTGGYDENGVGVGRPVQDAAAVARRDALLNDLEEMNEAVPDSPLDQVLNTFGHETVAEVTGRKRRVVWEEKSEGGRERVEQRRSRELSNKSEIQSFQDDKKQVLVFSEAGGTGASYHADRTAKNQRKRIHYLVQPGWKADTAIQGLGRTHRTNQAQAPTYVLVHTNISGQKRFISTIARRLTQLGALTKGSRKASGGGVFTAADNLESTEAHDSLMQFYERLAAGELDGLEIESFERQTGLELRNPANQELWGAERRPGVTQFLNRLLSMKFSDQNLAFDHFDQILRDVVAAREEAGTLDQGVETVKGENIRVTDDREVYRHPSGATANYVRIEADVPVETTPWADALRKGGGDRVGYYRDGKGRIWQVERSSSTRTDRRGRVHEQYRMRAPYGATKYINRDSLTDDKYSQVGTAEAMGIWDEQLASAPATRPVKHHMIAGVLLPIWDRLPGNRPRLQRALSDDGNVHLGVVIPPTQLARTLESLGAEVTQGDVDEILNMILEGNGSVQLTNGWQIQRARVQGETRIEIIGPGQAHTTLLENSGVIVERIGYKHRFFIPTGESMRGVWDRVTEGRPVARVNDGDQAMTTGGQGGAMGSPRRHNMPVNQAVTTGESEAGDVIGADDVGKQLSKWFGVPLRYGRLLGKNLRGVYKRLWMNARVKGEEAASLDVITHELAHGFDAKTDVLSNLSEKARSELKAMDYEPDKGRVDEGFAEYIRGRLTADFDVTAVASEFHKEFNDWLDNNTSWRDVMEKSKSLIDRWRNTTALGRVMGQVQSTGPERLTLGEVKERLPGWSRQAYQRLKEEAHFGYQFEKDLRSRGYAPKEGASFMDKYKAFTQGGPVLANSALESGVFTFTRNGEVKRIGPSLWDSLSKIEEGDYDTWVAFAYARHALEAWRKGVTPGLTQEDAQAVYDQFKGKDGWEDAAQAVTEFNNSMIEMLVDTGVITGGTKRAMLKKWKTYLPLHRVVEDRQTSGPGGPRLVDLPNPIKRRKGSGLKIVDPIQSTVQRAIWFYERAASQMVVDSMIKAAEKHGANGWIERLPPNQQLTKARVNEAWPTIRRHMEEAGDVDPEVLDDIEGKMDDATSAGWRADIINIYRPSYWDQSGEPVAQVVRDGKPMLFRFEPELYQTVAGMRFFQLAEFSPVLDKTFGALTRMVRAGATTLNPTFVARNFLRDMPTYLVQRRFGGKADPMTWIGTYFISEVQRRFGKTEDPFVKLWRQHGGQLSSVLSPDRRSMRKAVQSAVSGKQKFGLMETITDFMQVTEAGPRLAEFAAVFKEAGYSRKDVAKMIEDGSIPQETLVKALNAAHEVTVDFRRMGVWGRWLTRMIPFFNARLEGLDKSIRTVKDNPKVWAVRVFGYSVIPSILYWALNRDEDWYKERPPWLDAYWVFTDKHFGIGDEGVPVVRIPRGHEVSTIGSAAEAILDGLYKDDPKRVGEWANRFLKETPPEINVSGVSTSIEVWGNWDFFRDRPIVGRDKQDLEAGVQSYEYNTETMKAIGAWLGMSPAKLEHAVDSLTGGMYRRVTRPTEKFATGQPLDPPDYPIIQGFALRKDYSQTVDEFYKSSDKLKRKVATQKHKGSVVQSDARKAYSRGKYRDLMREIRQVTEKSKGRRIRFGTEKYIIGLAREAMGREELERYPNPLNRTDLPASVQKAVNDHLAALAFTVSRIDKLKKASPAMREASERAVEHLKSLKVDTGRLSRLLNAKLRKQGVKSEGRRRWRRTLRRRLR